MTEAVLRFVPPAPKPMSVAELNKAARDTLDQRFAASVWVEGEISSAKLVASGHLYFELKDEREDARLACVLWKGSLARVRAKMTVGEKILLRGKPTVYGPRGQFQFVGDTAMAAGAGAAAAAFEALKEKLRAEGLFDDERKRRVPRFPRVIGVVTSPSGAALQDILKVLTARWPVRVVVSPTLVQGAEAPAQIARAIANVQRLRALDVVIIGRGGGASEDLAAFNDERVARAIATCRVPVVSAVGHQVDHTLADLVADLRAATPTDAAALCTPVLAEERDRLDGFERRLQSSLSAKINALGVRLHRLQPKDPHRIINDRRQRLDLLMERAGDLLRRRLTTHRSALTRFDKRLEGNHPQTRLTVHRAKLQRLEARLLPAMQHRAERRATQLRDLRGRLDRSARQLLDRRSNALGLKAEKLDALSPLKILARGYSVALHEGRALIDAQTVAPGDSIHLRLHHGSLDATVTATNTET